MGLYAIKLSVEVSAVLRSDWTKYCPMLSVCDLLVIFHCCFVYKCYANKYFGHFYICIPLSWKNGMSQPKCIHATQLIGSLVLLNMLYLYPRIIICDGYTVFSLSVRPNVRPYVCPSVRLCFLNILKSYCWIFIKPCKHVHICKTNTLDKKVRARGQFY